jgi:hypothetical protein
VAERLFVHLHHIYHFSTLLSFPFPNQTQG